MPHEIFISAYKTGPLGYLISTRKALCILLVHKICDSRLQKFLPKWAGALLAILGAGVCGFHLLPISWAAGIFAQGVSLFVLILWLGAGEIFLKFAFVDERVSQLE